MSQLNILVVMEKLLLNTSTQIKTYINGTLYSILTRKILKEEAKVFVYQRNRLSEILNEIRLSSDATIARQVNYVLEQIEQLPNENQLSDSEDDFQAEEEAEEDFSSIEAEV